MRQNKPQNERQETNNSQSISPHRRIQGTEAILAVYDCRILRLWHPVRVAQVPEKNKHPNHRRDRGPPLENRGGLASLLPRTTALSASILPCCFFLPPITILPLNFLPFLCIPFASSLQVFALFSPLSSRCLPPTPFINTPTIFARGAHYSCKKKMLPWLVEPFSTVSLASSYQTKPRRQVHRHRNHESRATKPRATASKSFSIPVEKRKTK